VEGSSNCRFENGKAVSTRSTFRDVTQRKQAEAQIKRQVQHLTALREIDQAITSGPDLHHSLTVVLQQTIAALHVDAADVLVFNPHTQALEYGAALGFDPEAIEEMQRHPAEGCAGLVARERRLIHIPDAARHPGELRLAAALAEKGFVGYLGVPLIAKGQVRGVLETFLRSPFRPEKEWLGFFNALAGQAAIAIENSLLFEGLQRSSTDLALAYDATIEGLSRALDLRDRETDGHSRRVAEMAVRLGREYGLSHEVLVQIRRGALLHDMGKLGIPDHILHKRGPLSGAEWEVMRKHPTFAFEMLSPIQHLQAALDIPYCHHERWDGSGYPRGLKGEQIPIMARVFAVVDVWDAVTSDRPYRPAWSHEKALAHILAAAGSHFDPRVVNVFLDSQLWITQSGDAL
jgi:HD-GYP domain-containing protein (c-di-GMP phosphodiesterase class II)